MSASIRNMFCVMRVINASNEIMTVEQISGKTWLGTATVRHYTRLLAAEGLIEINSSGRGGRLRYMRTGLIECDPKIKGLYKTNKTSSEVSE